MSYQSIWKYVLTTFLLCIPAIGWNLAFGQLLPENYADLWFGNDISWLILIPESILRITLIILAAIMPLFIFTRLQRVGVVLYLIGMFLYFLSWRPLILYPAGDWSTSLIGFTAPVIVQIVWLSGIAMIGNRWFLKYPFSRWYFFSLAMLYSFFRFLHVLMVYLKDGTPTLS